MERWRFPGTDIRGTPQTWIFFVCRSRRNFASKICQRDPLRSITFQADKNDYRGLLAGLEGITGKKAVDSDALNVKN